MGSRNNTPRALSFGVELELYVAWITPDVEADSLDVPPGFNTSKGAPLRVPSGRFDDLLWALNARIRETLQGFPSAAVASADLNGRVDFVHDDEWSHLQTYREWTVKGDPSLSTPDELDSGIDSGWDGLEVCSPALWATEQGFAEVRRVCELLHDTIWTTNIGNYTGLHIHVGYGHSWFPMHSARRIAALLYAADPLLAASHDPDRLLNSFCPSIRMYSNVSLGVRIADLEMRPHSELEISDVSLAGSSRPRTELAQRIRDGFARSQQAVSSSSTRPYRGGLPPRPSTKTYTPLPEALENILPSAARNYGVYPDRYDFRPAPMQEAVAELLQTDNRWALGKLTTVSSGRSAYSFHHFLRDGGKRTIEFRQAAGTVDPAEVVSRARIAVRLCEFASNGSVQSDRYRKLLTDCMIAEDMPSWFDFYDLLLELDMRPEAEVIHAVKENNMTDAVRQRYWAAPRR
ncbi:uncharacterized protein GGS25DRAFT_531875 [Hypoxylon fragiforme]|uniref:uncharacterized protein n=1 Tax=Hypoxylon fragiforme TaxID=63214 RepID=UPI0020C697E5|nr:uncharacterized protein GGS25DRAFT_531875 [Hypoxylon fragiforme]KAI2608899.1 hypothetical protein GGS25DRAFT_531875 [Hypoxylon fragiforme]